MNEYQTKLINLRVRKVTAKNYFTLSSLVDEYDKLVEELMEDKENKNMTTTEQDSDLLLANQFSEAIDNVIEEILPLIDAKNLYYIINLKVKRLFEEYKDTALYGFHYDEFREAIISKIKLIIKREEDKKKEYFELSNK